MDTERTEHLIEIINEDIRRFSDLISDPPVPLYQMSGIYAIDGEAAAINITAHAGVRFTSDGASLRLWDHPAKAWWEVCTISVNALPSDRDISDQFLAQSFADHRDRIIGIYTGMLHHIKRQRAQLEQREEQA